MQVQRVQFNNPYISFQSNKKSWEKLKTLLSDPNGSDIGQHPINYKYEEAIAKVQKLLDMLDDNDDVTEVYHNAELPEEEEEE